MQLFALSMNGVSALADDEYKACWDINLYDESMFCYGAINWPIDEDNYYNAVRQDDLAKEWYRALLFKWKARANPEIEQPDNDCLAIARQVYCTAAFPKCVDFLRPK